MSVPMFLTELPLHIYISADRGALLIIYWPSIYSFVEDTGKTSELPQITDTFHYKMLYRVHLVNVHNNRTNLNGVYHLFDYRFNIRILLIIQCSRWF